MHFRSGLVAAVIICAASGTGAHAQDADPQAMAAEKSALAELSWMDGTWRGEAVIQTRNGPHKITHTERVGLLLDGSIRLVEGKGFNPDGSVGFNALGVISFDPQTSAYSFHSYALGHEGNFVFKPTTGGYVWEVPAGPMTIRYTATLKGGIWNEVGERIVAGQAPQRFFEMNLKRTGDSDWPMVGSQRPG